MKARFDSSSLVGPALPDDSARSECRDISGNFVGLKPKKAHLRSKARSLAIA
jgi:hypothetical protein